MTLKVHVKVTPDAVVAVTFVGTSNTGKVQAVTLFDGADFWTAIQLLESQLKESV